MSLSLVKYWMSSKIARKFWSLSIDIHHHDLEDPAYIIHKVVLSTGLMVCWHAGQYFWRDVLLFTSVMYVCLKELVVHTQIRTSAMVDAFLPVRHHRGIL
jgi:hypothetical protein